MSGSVSRSKNDPSESLQMIERPLMTPDDELKKYAQGAVRGHENRLLSHEGQAEAVLQMGDPFDEEHLRCAR